MILSQKSNGNRGFTLAELLIVVVVIVVLAGIAFVFVNPQEISYIEYNRSAEAIATAAQNRLTEIRNSGDMATLRVLGEQSAASGLVATAKSSDGTTGGYRYLFNYTYTDGVLTKTTGISYILPFGAIDYELAQHYFAIGFQSDTGIVGEVFYSAEPFAACTVDYLLSLQGDEDLRKAENIGYYKGTVDSSEAAFANLPTPQLTITNYEELTLSIYLPEVKQLEEFGKQLGIIVSLSDKNGDAYASGLKITQTAIYSTFSLGSEYSGTPEEPVVVSDDISSGATYKIVLDTVRQCDELDMRTQLTNPVAPPTGKFESWAIKSSAYKKGYYELGDNSILTVTVFCLYSPSDTEHYNAAFPVDPTFMPRAASVQFNGWFNNYNDKSVDIACGRHLQNLGNMVQMNDKIAPYAPTYTVENGVYQYGDYNYGTAHTYTDGSSDTKPKVDYDDITEKYVRRPHIKEITSAKQVNAIDFDCAEWRDKDGKPIPFVPVNLPKSFYYYGNYLTISHLYVDAPLYAGLFGYVYHPRLYDILLVNPSVTSQMPAHLAELYEIGVGALIGTSRDSSHINNCQVYMSQENGRYDSAKYRVTGECYVGGLIGFCEDEDIRNCSASVYTGYARGTTKSVNGKQEPLTSRYVGGLIGCITGDSSIDNCYAAGNLSGEYVGGLVGYIVDDSDPSGDDYRIHTCYTAGHIEYASKQASGLLGYISELSGNARSALSAYGNYCAIIYGEVQDGEYVWNGADIYGTFKGDGFEWLRTDTNGYSDVYLTGKYAHNTYFAGAVFNDDNKNYYIAQRGITYANSPYYTAMHNQVADFTQEIQSSSAAELPDKVASAKGKIVWLKKLQALEDLKTLMERIMYEVENETGLGPDNRSYNLGGYYKIGTTIYFDLDRARIDANESTRHRYQAMTLVQALHVIYDGTYTDGTTTYDLKDAEHNMNYGGDTPLKQKLNTYDMYTFMDYYNVLKETYQTLADDSATAAETADALQKLTDIFGDNSVETYTVTDSDGKTSTHYFYEKGLFYQHFYSDLLYRLFDKAKDYYQSDLGDLNGELIYRHFRNIAEEDFIDLVCDLGMSADARDEMLVKAKVDDLQSAIDTLNDYKTVAGTWANDMAGYKSEAQTLIGNVITALTSLQTAVQTQSPYSSEFAALKQTAFDAADAMYAFFDAHKNAVDYIDDAKKTGDMRNFRDNIYTFRKSIVLCTATANSGVENAIDELAYKLGQRGADASQCVNEFVQKVQTYLGANWANSDSGHKLLNAEQMRNAARGYVSGDDSDTRGESLGFMYDYNNDYYDQTNPYRDTTWDDHYVDKDNHIYNNVFPYVDNAYTAYYPFPFVFGREVEQSSDFQAVFVLFHYGDWLTPDLWADEGVAAVVQQAAYQLNAMTTYLADVETSKDTTGAFRKETTALSAAINGCVTQVNNVAAQENVQERNKQLLAVRNTVSGWLAKGGAFANPEQACADFKNGNQDKLAMVAEISTQLVTYRSELQALIDKIDKLIG